jgi:hypothetical protein
MVGLMVGDSSRRLGARLHFHQPMTLLERPHCYIYVQLYSALYLISTFALSAELSEVYARYLSNSKKVRFWFVWEIVFSSKHSLSGCYFSPKVYSSFFGSYELNAVVTQLPSQKAVVVAIDGWYLGFRRISDHNSYLFIFHFFRSASWEAKLTNHTYRPKPDENILA